MSYEYAIAVSRFGFSWDEFLDLTPREFYLALKDTDDFQMLALKPICNAIRLSTYWLVNIQLPKNKKIRNPKKLWEHSWDRNELPQTKEEMIRTMKFIAKATANNKKKGNKHR